MFVSDFTLSLVRHSTRASQSVSRQLAEVSADVLNKLRSAKERIGLRRSSDLLTTISSRRLIQFG